MQAESSPATTRIGLTPAAPAVPALGRYGAVQRLLDLGVALAVLLALSPLLLVIAGLVRATSPGPALHRAQRVGQGGRLFRLYKFRSMVADAARRGPGITAAGDPRITPLGRFLRATKLDELPQFLNVLRGDMSLVGPRPEDPRYVAHYTPEQRRVLAARPGITSLASLRYRSEEALLTDPNWEQVYLEQVLPDKLALELDYLARRSLWTDLVLLLRTAAAVFLRPPAAERPAR